MEISDWSTVSKTIREILRGFRDLDMHVIFIAQETVMKDGDKIEKYVPSLNGKSADEIAYFMDVVGYMSIDPATGERRITTIPSTKTLAKDRTGKIGNDTEPNFTKWVELVSTMEVSEQSVTYDSETPETPAPIEPEQKETIEALMKRISKEKKLKISEVRKKTADMVHKSKIEDFTKKEATAIISALEKSLVKEETPAEEKPAEPEAPAEGANMKKIREMYPTMTDEQKAQLKVDPMGADYNEKQATKDVVTLLS